MVQGTMSNVGKSLLVAGLARVFAQDGYRVAPFKAQNMALNSGVTMDGLEMGRAQLMQAEAAGVESDVRMNPILLKPEGHIGSQVIVMGEAVDSMPARAYFRYRERLVDVVRGAYGSLAADFDIVLIEGAGSPAEVNLGRDPFVNMGMARLADAPVLLVGDIDPGGVFAQLYGTLELLEPEDRARVKGLVVNKLRGDATLLEPGLSDFGARCGVPVLGAVPYVSLDLDDEDSLSDRLCHVRGGEDSVIDIAVIRLPHLSNFTDFNALDRVTGTCVRYVSDPERLGRPDLLIVPGTKRTMDDLRWLRASGTESCIRALAAAGTPVVGICGGFQMLGESLVDDAGTEGGGELSGLGLLPVQTVFGPHKRRVRTGYGLRVPDGPFARLDGLEAQGYEIHTGQTTMCQKGTGAFCHILPLGPGDGGGGLSGLICGNVLGTYLHGFFDATGIAEALVSSLLEARGLPGDLPVAEDWAEARQRSYDILADTLRAHLDIDAIYRIMGVLR